MTEAAQTLTLDAVRSIPFPPPYDDNGSRVFYDQCHGRRRRLLSRLAVASAVGIDYADLTVGCVQQFEELADELQRRISKLRVKARRARSYTSWKRKKAAR